MCLFEKVDEVWHPKKDMQKHIPVEPWDKKGKKRVELRTHFFIKTRRQREAWFTASPSTDGKKVVEKCLHFSKRKDTPKTMCKITFECSRGLKKAEKKWFCSSFFHQMEALKWRFFLSLPVYGWKTTCAQSSVNPNTFWRFFFRRKNEYRSTDRKKYDNFI